MSVSGPLVASLAPIEAIVRLAQRYPVFPCRRVAEEITVDGRARLLKPKSPLTPRGFFDATQDPDQIRAWWRRWPDALVGVPTGAATGLLVVDFDADKADEAARLWVESNTNWLLQTRSHATVSGGRHYLFRPPSGQHYGSGVNVELEGVQRIGIDVRCEGGYIVWWPLHGATAQGEIAPLPAGLIRERDLNTRELPPLTSHSPAKWAEDRALVQQALAWIDPTPHDEWLHVGMALHLATNGSEEGFALWHDWSVGELTGEVPASYSGERDCRARWVTFNREERGRAGTVTLGTVFALARRAGWHIEREARAPIGAAEVTEKTEGTEETAAKRIDAVPFEWIEPQSIPPRQWLYGRHYMRGMVSATAGIGGAGKSSVLIVEALSMAVGRDLLQGGEALPVGPIKVWLHNGEDPMEELQRRFAAVIQHYGITREDIADRLRVTSGRDTPILVAEVLADGGRVLTPTEHGRLIGETITREGISVFIADPFVTLHRVNENDNVMIDGVMTIIRNLAHSTGCAVELAHHFRKLGTSDASVDDVRGASSIIGACRSVRIVSQMTKEEGEKYGLQDEERRSHIWLQNGKANMLPPLHARRWMHLTSVDLGNAAPPFASDKVGVPHAWEPPDARLEFTGPEFRAVRAAIKAEQQPINALRYDVRSRGWVGKLIARAAELDADDPSVRNDLKGTIEQWIQRKTLVVKEVRDPKQARSVSVVEWVDSEDFL